MENKYFGLKFGLLNLINDYIRLKLLSVGGGDFNLKFLLIEFAIYIASL